MRHRVSPSDQDFRRDFEAARISPADFDHQAHVRLAYVVLAEHDDATAIALLRSALLAFLDHHAVPASKYHETLTTAWMLAVRHFMQATESATSADDFIAQNPRLLDSSIMLGHYSRDLLFSDRARAAFAEPDRVAIPRYG